MLFCALVGAVLVLVVGGMWRRSKENGRKKSEQPAE
jgi:hypothetical protein